MNLPSLKLRLEQWYDSNDVDQSRSRANGLLRELLALPKDEWRSVDPMDVLELLDVEGEIVLSEDGLVLLELIRDRLDSPSIVAFWRSLRVLHKSVPPDVWEGFWDDFLSEDAIRHSSPSAVVAPALKRKDPYFVSMVKQSMNQLPPEEQETKARLLRLVTKYKVLEH